MPNKKSRQKKYGFKPDLPDQQDFVFGYSLPFELLQKNSDWTDYLPVKERQNKGFETYACISFGTLSIAEALIKRKYGIEENFSDRFLAVASETKRGGNSPKKVYKALKDKGVVSEEDYLFNAETFKDFYAPIPNKIKKLAKEFTDKYEFRYEIVPDNNKAIQEALKCSPLGISVSAWYRRGDGYYKPKNARDNHFTVLYKLDDKKRIFDTYEPFLKDYDLNANHSVIHRYWIQKRRKKKNSRWSYLLDYLRKKYGR